MSYNSTFIEPFINGTNLNILGFISAPYVGILGDYFYLLFGLLPIFLMYLKSQDLTIPLIASLLYTACFGIAFPENISIALIMLLGSGVGAVLFQVFKGGGN